jgi:hypothetical protein
LNGDFETDLAFIQPVAPSGSVSQGSATATVDTGGINFEPFDIGLTYRFGGGEEIPPPKVGAFVRPSAFTPSQGEKATFFLDTTEDVNIHHWSVLIYDQSNQLVRGLRGTGSPPTKLLWGGENDQYEPLPPGVYTWAFQVQDQLDHVGSTPVQTVEILGPPMAAGARDPSKLLGIRQQQEAILAQERQQLSALAQDSLKKLLGVEEAGSPTNNASAPAEAQGNTNYPALGLEGVKNLTPGSVINSHREQTPYGDVAVLSYQSKLNDPTYVEEEVAGVMKNSVNSVGTTDFKYLWFHVYYGLNKNELSMETPVEAAANYASGKIDLEKLKQLSEIHINGIKVGSNGY